MSARIALALLALLCAAPASGAEPAAGGGAGAAAAGADSTEPAAGRREAFQSPTRRPLLRTAAVLGGLCACGIALSLWARRRRGFAGGGPAARIELLASRPLGPRHRVVLIEVEGRRLLLGVGADAVSTLADLTDEARFAAALERRMGPAGEPGDFGLGSLGRFEGLDG
jgi:flagellar biogenesis protein FliO